MRALVIAPQPFFSPRGTPFSVYYRTLVTAQLGVRVDLLTYGAGQDVDIPGVRIIRIPRFRFLEPIPVGPSVRKIFLDVFVVLWSVALLLRHRYDFVHAHEESVFFSRFLKPLFGFKLVYDMHSSLPQQLVNFRFTSSRLLIRLFERLENSCLARSDAVITICPDLAEYALPRIPDARRHFLIENSIIEEVRLRNGNGRHGPAAGGGAAGGAGSSPEEQAEPLPAGRPLVVYAGTFEPYQGIDLLLRAFARARERIPAAFLLLVGGRPDQVEHYRRLARDLGLEDHCRFTGQVPQAVARAHSRRASVLVSPRVSGTNTPLKIYEQLASGTPLVATRIHSHTQVLDDAVCFLADPTPEGMAEGLVAALCDGERRDRTVAAARRLYEERYSRPAYEQKMRQLLEVLR